MLGRRTGLIIANTIAGAGLGFAAIKVFAVETGPYAEGLLGQLAFAMGLAGLLSIGLDFGLGSAHIKRVSEGRGAEELGRLTASYGAVKVALAAAFVAVVAAGAWAAAQLGLLQDTPRFAVVLVAIFYAFLGLRTIFTATFDGRQEFAKSQATVLTENVVRAPLVMLFAIAFGGAVLQQGPLAGYLQGPGAWLRDVLAHRGADLLAACYALAAFASMVAGWLLFRRGYPMGRPSRAVLEDYWGFARHIFVAVAVGTVYVSLDKVVITAFWAPENTGRYFGAQRFSDLISMVPIAVYTVLFPALSGSYARGERGEVRAAIEAALRHVSLLVVPLAAFALALPGPLVSLVLTGEFAAAVPTVRLLAVFAFVYALLYPYATLLHALGRPDATARAAIVATVLNVMLNLAFVPRPEQMLGLPVLGLAEAGSGLATVIAATVQMLLLRHAVHRLEGPVPVRHVVKHLLGGAAMVAVLLPLAPAPEQAHWYVMVGLLALGGAVYLAVLAALREFTSHDLKLYLHILDPAAMARYIADEVQAHGPAGREPPPPGGPRP